MADSNADLIDAKITQGHETGILSGVPVIIKDNLVYSGYPATWAGACPAGGEAPTLWAAVLVEKPMRGKHAIRRYR